MRQLSTASDEMWFDNAHLIRREGLVCLCAAFFFFGMNLDECKLSAPAFFINRVQFAHCRNQEMMFAFHLEAAVTCLCLELRRSLVWLFCLPKQNPI